MNYKQWLPLVALGGISMVGAYLSSKLKLILKDTEKSTFSDDVFKVQVRPVGVANEYEPKMCTGMMLEVENFTDEDISIDWGQTFYTFNGQTEEGFLHGGGKALRTQMVMPRRSDIVFPKSILIKQLKPLACIKEFEIPSISQLPIPAGNQTVAAPLQAGVHGVYLCVNIKEKPFKQHISFELAKKESKGLMSRFFSNKESK